MSNNKSLADFFNAINPEKLMIEKAKKAGRQFEQQLYDKAIEGVYEYYDGYKPRQYSNQKRTFALANTVEKYYSEGRENGNFTVTCGVKFDASVLKGVHSSNSKYHQTGSTWVDRFNRKDNGANGIPEYDWIFDKFYDSLHPVFNFKTWEQGFKKAPKKTQWQLMDEYLHSSGLASDVRRAMSISLSDLK